MFLKNIIKYCKTEKTYHTYYRLCESYRDEFGMSRQRMVLGLGRLLEIPDLDQKILLTARINELIKGTPTLFNTYKDQSVEQLAQQFYRELKVKRKIDKRPGETEEWETVDLKTLKNKDVREIGAESLCYQAFNQLNIDRFLHTRGWKDEDIKLAATHIISRAVYPASEYKTVSWIKENSAICELTGYDMERVTKDKLYGISHKLYREKEQLENHLSRCTNELFDLEDKIILYDLTNTYFEGRMKDSRMAKFGRSKEKRNDARLIVLALIVNTEGFLKYSDIFQGNTTDCQTLKMVIEKLDSKVGYMQKKPTIVMDAGIATDANIAWLKSKQYDYLCVSRSNLKEYKADTDKGPVQIYDKRKQPIELLHVRVENDTDNYLWVKSHAKAIKENSMNEKFSERFELGLDNVQKGINTKGGTKNLNKVWERIGRLKEKYSSTHQYYEIEVLDNGQGLATGLVYSKKAKPNINSKAGIYFLRTSLNHNDEQTLWSIYNTITEIEYTFRVLKTDLDLRPIYHKTDDASMAHLHLGLLAYWLVATLRYQLKNKGVNYDWRELVRIMNTQKRVTTTIKGEGNKTIQIKQCSEPIVPVIQIYQALNYKPVPLPRKKSVWHTEEILKKFSPVNQYIDDG
jgi:transposase